MRSKLAIVVLVAALVSALPAALDFAGHVQTAFHFGNVPVTGGAWLTFGRALAWPTSLLASAVIVEMLFRISERLPASPAGPDGASRPAGRGWRNPLAKLFLVVALVAYAASAWALFRYIQVGGAAQLGIPAESRIEMTFSTVFYWLTAPLEIVLWAAGIEYVSRIASALQPRVVETSDK